MDNIALRTLRHHVSDAIARGEKRAIVAEPCLPVWYSKIKRYSIKGRMYWYRTDDGGMSWNRISRAEAMRIIDAMQGIVIG